MINYKTIQAGGTSTDLNVSVDGLNLILEMSYYKSGIHQINRSGEDVIETIEFGSTYSVNTKVTIYLVEDFVEEEVSEGVTVIRNDGQFVVDVCRVGIDQPYQPEGLIMHVGDFTIPVGELESLEDLEISAIKVVGGSE